MVHSLFRPEPGARCFIFFFLFHLRLLLLRFIRYGTKMVVMNFQEHWSCFQWQKSCYRMDQCCQAELVVKIDRVNEGIEEEKKFR